MEAISAAGILTWFLWGLFMGAGWSVGAWAVGKILVAIG